MRAAIVVLYEPGNNIKNINHYCNDVDVMIVLDNSKKSNIDLVGKVLDLRNERNIYKHFESNIGLCAALNIGMDIASSMGCEWALLMDDDSGLESDIISVYDDYILNNNVSDIAILAPVHLFERSSASEYKGNVQRKWVMTSGCYYNIKKFIELNGFFEELFVDCLDLDYCYKARERGYKILECGQALVNHHPAVTKSVMLFGVKLFSYGMDSSWRYYLQSRNLVWLILRHRHFEDVIRLAWKYFKVIFLFENKMEYLKGMKKGRIEGKELYKKYKGRV